MNGLIMERRSLLRALAMGGAGLAATGLIPSGAARLLAAAGSAASSYPAMDALVKSYVARGVVPGALGLIGRGTDAPAMTAVGMIARGEAPPVDIDTLWRAYSMTKPVTGIAAMILMEDGKLELDQPIADFIPEFAQMRVLKDPDNDLESVPAKTQITVRHLLTHTAGLGYTIVTGGPLLLEYMKQGINPAVVSRNAPPTNPPTAPTPPIDEFARRVAGLALIAEPGTRWSYSISLDLLGYVIQLASGSEFSAFLQERIFDPLDMRSTYFEVPDAETGRLATNYTRAGEMLLPLDPGANSIYTDPPAFPFGGAGLVCSARDYDRFLAMLVGRGALGRTRVMKEETVLLATSNLLPEGVSLDGTDMAGSGFGAGGRVGLGDRSGNFGWGGAASTVGFVDLRHNFRASGWMQLTPSRLSQFGSEFTGAAYRDVLGGAAMQDAA